MGVKENLTKKLAQATVDKTDLNRRVMKLKKSFDEVDKFLGAGRKDKKRG